MFNNNGQNILNYKSTIFVCEKLGVKQDENLNQYVEYGKPRKCRFNVQSVSEESEIREFGELAPSMKVALITEKNKYMNKFKEFDKVYVDTRPSDEEIKYGENADYRVYSVRPQNSCIRMYLLKLVK